MKKLSFVLVACLLVSVGLAAPKPVPGACPECDAAAVSAVYVEHLTAYLEGMPSLTSEQSEVLQILLELHKLRAVNGLESWQHKLGNVIEARLLSVFEEQQLVEIFKPIKEVAPKSTYKAIDDQGVMFYLQTCDCAGAFPDCSWTDYWNYCCRRWQPWDSCNVDPECCGLSGMADCTGMCRDKDDC